MAKQTKKNNKKRDEETLLSEAHNPLILRCHRLMEAFAKADDERDFFLDRTEGFILFADLNRTQEELDAFYQQITDNPDRYVPIPKLTFYETKKIMESFVNEKVYDIDTKEKLLDIIQSKEARENFLEFVYDHHSEFEKWQQFYQERSRIRIIEWLRNNNFLFVFEEDLDIAKATLEKIKLSLFQAKAGKDVIAARKLLFTKAKSYYSSEALNPRPKRGRPPKQAVKQENEPQLTQDIYLSAPSSVRPFLFTPSYGTSIVFTFSSKFENEEELIASRRAQRSPADTINLADFNSKLASLRTLSNHWLRKESEKQHKEGSEQETLIENESEEELLQKKSSAISKNGSKEAKQAAPKKAAQKKLQPSSKPEKQ